MRYLGTVDESSDVATQKDILSVSDTDSEVIFTPDNVSGPVGARLTVPTHMTPAGGQTTHPSVVFVPEGWGGYKYWMAHTPYPGGNDDHEDPNIVASQDGINWEVPAGLTNPLDDVSGTEYNSDVDLVLHGGTLYLFWRFYNPANTGTEERIYLRTSTDGVTWTAKVLVYQSDDGVRRLVSPTLVVEDDGKWTMWAVDIVPSPNQIVRLRSTTDQPTLAGGWDAPQVCTTGAMQPGKEPWHLSVRKVMGRYFSVLTDCDTDVSGVNGDILFMSSDDGLTWANSTRTIIPRFQAGEHDQLYRASLVPAVEDGRYGFRVWYSAWTASPEVWNIYRTFISVGSAAGEARASGQFNVPAGVAANGNTALVTVTFPPGLFSQPPLIRIGSDSSRATMAYNNVTSSGFTFIISNWTPGNISSTPLFFWDAVEPADDGTGPVRDSGTFNPSASIGASSTQIRTITFATAFATVPRIRIGTNSSRATMAYSNVTTTGFDFIISNWTSVSINTGALFYWDAVED